jgi:hypothetical protein
VSAGRAEGSSWGPSRRVCQKAEARARAGSQDTAIEVGPTVPVQDRAGEAVAAAAERGEGRGARARARPGGRAKGAEGAGDAEDERSDAAAAAAAGGGDCCGGGGGGAAAAAAAEGEGVRFGMGWCCREWD